MEPAATNKYEGETGETGEKKRGKIGMGGEIGGSGFKSLLKR